MPPLTQLPTTELGTVATWAQMGGIPYDPAEETPELIWPHSVHTFDRMRRTSGQIRAVMWALTLPMRRAGIWSIDPNGARPEVVDLISTDVDVPVMGAERRPAPRLGGRFSFGDHLRLALLSLSYGHMMFEQVVQIVDGRARLRKLSPRFPASIWRMDVDNDGGLEAIHQYAPYGVRGGSHDGSIRIPVDRLVAYVLDREGAAWQGNSILRPVYKHWLLLDRLMRVQVQVIERNGMGVPWVEAPPGVAGTQLKDYVDLAQAFRAGANAGVALPNGAKLHLAGVQGSLPDAQVPIDAHETAIARSVLAQFLQLGNSGGRSGNRALGKVFVDFFSSAMDSLASQIADTFTQHVIEDLVDWNWGPDEPAPRLVARPVDADEDLPVESLVALLRTGAVAMDDELEGYLRNRYRLPARGSTAPRPLPTGAAPSSPSSMPVAASAGRPVAAARGQGRIATALRLGDEVAATVRRAVAGVPRRDKGTAAAVALSFMAVDDAAVADQIAAVRTEGYTAGVRRVPARRVSAAGADLATDPTRRLGQLQDSARLRAQEVIATARRRATDAAYRVADEADDEMSDEELDSAMADEAGREWLPWAAAGLIAATEFQRSSRLGASDEGRAQGATGYRWVLTASHGATDICDDYAAETYGPDDEPPDSHPRCTCEWEPEFGD